MHPDLVPYPTDLNTPAGILLKKLTGGDVPLECAVHAAYQVAGVGLGAALPHGPHVFGSAAVSEENCVAVLREATAPRAGLGDLIPEELRRQLIQVALTLLLRWLGS